MGCVISCIEDIGLVLIFIIICLSCSASYGKQAIFFQGNGEYYLYSRVTSHRSDSTQSLLDVSHCDNRPTYCVNVYLPPRSITSRLSSFDLIFCMFSPQWKQGLTEHIDKIYWPRRLSRFRSNMDEIMKKPLYMLRVTKLLIEIINYNH